MASMTSITQENLLSIQFKSKALLRCMLLSLSLGLGYRMFLVVVGRIFAWWQKMGWVAFYSRGRTGGGGV